MNLSELTVAGTLGVGYLDAKLRLSQDLHILPNFFTRVFQHIVHILKGKVNFWYTFESVVEKYSENIALVYPRRIPGKTTKDGDNQFEIEKYTYQELYDIILRLSYILSNDYGITSKDTIAIDCTNKPLFIFLWFSLWNIGAVPSFLNYNITHHPLVHCLKIVDAAQCFVDPDAAGPIKDALPELEKELPKIKINFIDEQELMKILLNKNSPKYRAPDNTRRPDDNDWDIAALIYTSGTTGLPKSAIMSWRKSFFASTVFGQIVKIKSDSTVFTAMPLYHSTAAMLGILPAISVGAAVALSHNFSASTFWTQVKITKATHFQYVGEVCRYLLNSPRHPDEKLHQAKIAYGNGLRADIWKEFKERFGIIGIGEFYAATEAPIATTSFQTGDFGIGACRNYGKFINFVLDFQQRIVKMDPEDDSNIWRDPVTGFAKLADYNEPGELLYKIMNPKRPEMSFQGYLNNKRETNSKIIRDVFKKGDAYFRSGDLLKMDKDGLFYFIDRLGDTFRWKSENVSATEVENEILKLKEILQCVVVGVKIPNHEGRCGYAVLQPRDDMDLQNKKELQQFMQKLSKHVISNLPVYARPYFIQFCKIESTDNHKIAKKQFKNPQLPKGITGDQTIYWLNPETSCYEILDEFKWMSITQGKARL
ncbi:hypothetical protein PACTADRAFT_48495 [Pachysolen tannophilus NRRL Y-2460]|uniref:Very long-chain fatty acid transport protein n=1 Tax=Pachysolen tannophilus NRRL Y-2460 TaxID=669874 RepID=A0A1E4TY33_PACTA|nr:hypothetical protein PACTADRAFT_48495 [Pachysolen tannophilus NRRL Y-2460]